MILFLRVVPGFSVAVEEAARPRLRSGPVVIHASASGRGLIGDVNSVAQRCGVRAGMSLAQVRQYCPDCVVLAPNLARYEAVWEELVGELSAFTPLVEPVEMGQAVCDLTGCERQWDVYGAASQIRRIFWERGLEAWIGIGGSRIVAEMAAASVGADGITIVERGQERRFLADLPLTMLPNIDPRMALTFQILGLRTIGQFAALPAGSVKHRFGAEGERLHRWANGIDPRPVVPPPPKPCVRVSRECDEGTMEEVLAAIHRLAEECAGELQRRGVGGRVVSCWLLVVGQSSVVSHRSLVVSRWPGADGVEERDGRTQVAVRPLGQVGGEQMDVQLPVPYRIHSMLPQPGSVSVPRVGGGIDGRDRITGAINRATTGGRSTEPTTNNQQLTTFRSATRTGVSEAGPLEERVRGMIVAQWPWRDGGLIPALRITLEVSEFEAPVQLAFAELGRIDETGRMRGMDAARLHALLGGERVLAARHGDSAFRHVTKVDPGCVVTERRFQWKSGFSPVYSLTGSGRSGRSKRKRGG